MIDVDQTKSLGNPYKKQLRDLSILWNLTGKAKDIYGIERFFLILLSAFLMLMPTMFVRWIFGLWGLHKRKVGIELYALAKPVILLLILGTGTRLGIFGAVVAIVFLTDLYSYLLGIVLLRDFWRRPFSYGRSLILLGINLIEFVTGFAILYLYCGNLRQGELPVTEGIDAFYFSVVTTMTVGYGDITPSGFGRVLTIIQIFASLGLLAILLSNFVSNLKRKRTPVR